MSTSPIDLDRAQVVTLFAEALSGGRVQRYKKFGRVICRPVVPGETVITIVGGKVETMRRAPDDAFVLRNIEIGSSAEQYIISGDKFKVRYALEGGQPLAIDGQRWEAATPTGECEAFVYEGEPITFMAPWNEKIMADPGDMIARVPGQDDDIYRIAKDEFTRTYKLITPTA